MIPAGLYKQILELMPVCCVDVIVKNADKYLLVKRLNEPAKGRWWVPGGRVFKNDSVEETALRVCKEEVGISEIKFIKKLGVYETKSDTSAFGVPTHTVNIMCLVESEDNEITLDSQSGEAKWCSDIEKDDNLNKDVIKFLEEAGFKKNNERE